jgi:hypothetical protein
MTLSDSCFEFLETFGKAARGLAEEVHWYAAPGNPLRYGEEIDALRRACAAVAEMPYDPEAGARLLRLATSVMRYHDTPPGAPAMAERQAEMTELVRLLRSNLDAEDASAVPSTVEHITEETPFTAQAATRLAGLLPKLGKPAYEAAIKIITDIGSATAKKMLGL